MSAPDPRMEELADLVPLFAHENPDVRQYSLQLLLGFSHEEAHLTYLSTLGFIRPIIRLIKDERPVTGKLALQLLVNFSTNTTMLEEMIKVGIVTSVMEHLSKSQKDPKFALMILNNVSLNFQGAVEILQEGLAYEGLHINRLIKWFNDPFLIKRDEVDEWARAGAILSNMTQLESFRRMLADEKRAILSSMKNHLIGESVERKLCVLRIIHNLSNDVDKHYIILEPEQNIWSLALSSIVAFNAEGAIDDEDMSFINPLLQSYFKTSTKKYEENTEVRKLIIDTVFTMCRNQPARKYLRAVNMYQILRELHMYEREVEHDAADELLTEDIIPYFILDEQEKEDKDKIRSASVALDMLRYQSAGHSLEQVLEYEAEITAESIEGTSLPGFAVAEEDENADIVSAATYTKKMDELHRQEEARLNKVSDGKEMPSTYGGVTALDFF